jgi:hypothetical protein
MLRGSAPASRATGHTTIVPSTISAAEVAAGAAGAKR